MPGEGGKRLSALLSSRNCRAICQRKDSGWCHRATGCLSPGPGTQASALGGNERVSANGGIQREGFRGTQSWVPIALFQMGACQPTAEKPALHWRDPSVLQRSHWDAWIHFSRCLWARLLHVLLALFREKLGRGRTMGCCIAPPTVLGPWVILFFSLYCFVSLKKNPSFLS